MRQEIIARQRKIMADNGLDALVAVSPENFAWTSGFVVPSQPILRWRHAMVVVKADGSHAVVARRHGGNHRPQSPAGRGDPHLGRVHRQRDGLPGDAPVRPGARVGAHRHRDGLSAGRRLRALCSARCRGATFSAAEQLYARSRQIKTPEEIALLRRLSRIADASITDAFAAVEGRQHRDGYRRRA